MGGLSPLPLVQGGPAPAGRPWQIPPVPSTLYVLGVVLGGLSPEDQTPFNGGAQGIKRGAEASHCGSQHGPVAQLWSFLRASRSQSQARGSSTTPAHLPATVRNLPDHWLPE